MNNVLSKYSACIIQIVTYQSQSSASHTFTIALLSATFIKHDCSWMYHRCSTFKDTSRETWQGYKQDQYFIKVFYTVNISPWIRITIIAIHSIHQNIIQMVPFDKNVPVLLYQKLCLCVSSSLYFQDYDNPIAQSTDSFLLFRVKLH